MEPIQILECLRAQFWAHFCLQITVRHAHSKSMKWFPSPPCTKIETCLCIHWHWSYWHVLVFHRYTHIKVGHCNFLCVSNQATRHKLYIFCSIIAPPLPICIITLTQRSPLICGVYLTSMAVFLLQFFYHFFGVGLPDTLATVVCYWGSTFL